MIHIPDSRVFTEPLANYTAGFPFLWNELPVLVTFESDWRKAKEILQRIADEEAMETSHEAEMRRGTAEAIWEKILDAFAGEESIDFAYPTQRVYLNPIEGKSGARADLPPLSQPRP